jgi:microcin C transport system substrate-binding protein
VRRGTHNFDRITVKIYKDNTARLEALKAGEFDMMRFFRPATGPAPGERQALHTGELVKHEFRTRSPRASRATCSTAAAQAQDPRVREALGLALDYEWMNRQMFYNGYRA